ncbi:hypothetical protein PYCCODRAFT_1419686 [Trametes coccinea BRFM310]|uniref:Fungal-type protein kinase domain-containing protein n=1 Tax=Trametes coccinea (strain BRFM310) TaxID=1353009 RepID=A0A1Y2I872_TRAC3|nr:hypothetical protein PYCCODRAFT_1419686 [Trametes coccinea BRFM310]
MPPTSFIEDFLPVVSSERHDLLSPRNAFAAVPHCADSPAEVYEPLASTLNKTRKHKARCPGFVFEKTIERSTRPDRLGHAKPHICCFASENLGIVQRAEEVSRIEFGYAELFIQVATSPLTDYFIDPEPGADMQALIAHQFTREFDDDEAYDLAQRAWGMHIAFATEVFARQQRTFLFTVSVFGSSARLFRWDRSGCVVSEAFDVHQHSAIFAEFFWRFSQLSDAERGHDLTYRISTQSEETLFRDTVRAYVALQLDISGDGLDKALTMHYQPGHVTKLSVKPSRAEERGTYDLLVSRPVVSPLHLDGRCTRGFWAVDVKTAQVVFLKDTWRTPSQSETEGDVIGRLNELGVRNVPTLLSHGDVFDPTNDGTEPAFQETRTNQYVSEPWSRCIDEKDVYVSKRRHYRLVMGTVGYSIKTLRGTEELLHSTFDVFIAMKDAYEKGSRIHRDLSVGNVILVKEPDRPIRRGYLIDWDASDLVDEAGEALHSGRAGTWSFMSIRMLDERYVDAKQTFKDDMESLLYVVLYCALFYLPHSLSGLALTSLHAEFFERMITVDGVTCGGSYKLLNATKRVPSSRIRWGSAAFAEWLNTVMDYHRPPPELKDKYKDRWNAEDLAAFWSQFLETHELERDDHVVHRISKVSRHDPNSPETPSPPLPSPTPEPKRSRADSSPGPEGAPRSKRGRLDDTAGETALTGPAAPAGPVPSSMPGSPSGHAGRSTKNHPLDHSTSTPRRSERIRNRESTTTPVAVPATRILKAGAARRTARRRADTKARR